MTLDDKKNAKNANIFICKLCDFKCCKLSNMDKHNLSLKHKKNDAELPENAAKDSFFCNCGKEYKFRQGLWKHKKKCLIEINKSSNILESQNITPDIVLNVIQQNQEFKNLLVEQNKQNFELQKQHNELQKYLIFNI
jgi:hypothetical protein